MKDIKILSASRYSSTDEISRITGGVNYLTSSISGRSNLVQRVVKIMLTQVGSNAYTPDFGCSINELQKISQGTKNVETIRTVLSNVVLQVENYIKNEQQDYQLPLDELLDKIDIIDILFNERTKSWNYRLSIYNQAGLVSILEL